MARSMTATTARHEDETMGRPVVSVNARTGAAAEKVAEEATAAEVAEVCRAAAAAREWLRSLDRQSRAALLRACAVSLEETADEIVVTADRETALGAQRLTGELARTVGQLRLFAEVVEEGSYLDVTLDRADAGAQPLARPDLRRTKVPLGAVAVFGASNFPLAFSVAGGDTASALAAGCPVVVKAHPAHPATSELVAARLRAAVRQHGGPAGVIGLVHGVAAGRAVVEDPRVAAVGFTGSVPGGRALFDLASRRPTPIPFYGELGSLNPLLVLPHAADDGDGLGQRIADSVLLGAGQFCTKPGLVLVPTTAAGDKVVAGIRDRAANASPSHLLTRSIRESLRDALPGLLEGTQVLVADRGTQPEVGATVVEVAASELLDRGDLLEEHFGPFAVVARYGDPAELEVVLDRLDPFLVGTVHAAEQDLDLAARLLPRIVDKAGRIAWNGFPTGVQVSWAMTHGGPYPATTSPLHTSVGAGAIARWMRPVTYQDVPDRLLPPELTDPSVPRRVDGLLIVPALLAGEDS